MDETTLRVELVEIDRPSSSALPRKNYPPRAPQDPTPSPPGSSGHDRDAQTGNHRKPRTRQRVEVTCPGCGKARIVRSNSFRESPPRCRACASRLPRRQRKKNGSTIPCALCRTPFYRYPSETTKRFCSHECASRGKKRYRPEARTCRTCGAGFDYTPKPRSNTSGHYCSLRCRDTGYLGVVHGAPSKKAKSERRGWRSRRNRFLREGHDFCAVCGVREPLHVHHIEGYRNTRFDDLRTVVTVCPRHHALLEKWTKCIVKLEPVRRRHAALVILGCLGDSWAFHSGRALAAGRAG